MFFLIPFSLSACDSYDFNVNYGRVETLTFQADQTSFCKKINFIYTQRSVPHTYFEWLFPSANGDHTVEFINKPQTVSQVKNHEKTLEFSIGNIYKTTTIDLQLSETGTVEFRFVAFDGEEGSQTTIISWWANEYIKIGKGSSYDFEWEDDHTYNFVSLNNEYGDITISGSNDRSVSGKYNTYLDPSSEKKGTFDSSLSLQDSKFFATSIKYKSGEYITIGYHSGNNKGAKLIFYPHTTKVDDTAPKIPPPRTITPKRTIPPFNPLRCVFSSPVKATFLVYFLFVFVFVLINTIICCVFPNRMYRAGIEYPCCYSCCIRASYKAIAMFYSKHRYSKCCQCDCDCCYDENHQRKCCNCDCSCRHDDCCNGCDGEALCAFGVFVAIIMVVTGIIAFPFLLIYLLVHLIISCGGEEREFEKGGFKIDSANKGRKLQNIQSQKTDRPPNNSSQPPPPPPYYGSQTYQHAPPNQQQPYYYSPQQQPYSQQNYNQQQASYGGPPPPQSM